jgi:hypothetical protein
VAFVAPMWNSNTARYSEKWVNFGLPKEELDALAKNPVQLHDTNSVVALVQIRRCSKNIQINAACIPAEYISEEPLQIIPF